MAGCGRRASSLGRRVAVRGSRDPHATFCFGWGFVKILVDRLSAAPLEESFSVSREWLAQHVADSRGEGILGLADAAQFVVRAQRMGADLYLEGDSGSLELACSRCLTRYRGPIREQFRLVLEPAGDRVPADPEGAAALAQDGLYLATSSSRAGSAGSEIELDRSSGEMLSLSVPVQPLCREDCRGLCPRCGADRNSRAAAAPSEAEPRPSRCWRAGDRK